MLPARFAFWGFITVCEVAMSDEVWKDVPDYEGIYQVSNLGRVKSLDRRDCMGRFRKSQIIKCVLNSQGYLVFKPRKNGGRRNLILHILVAKVFLGERPEGLEIDHRDNNRANPRVDNLEYVTHGENVLRGKLSDLNPNKSSVHRNVYRTKLGKFVVTINNSYRGLFESEEEAVEAALAEREYEKKATVKSTPYRETYTISYRVDKRWQIMHYANKRLRSVGYAKSRSIAHDSVVELISGDYEVQETRPNRFKYRVYPTLDNKTNLTHHLRPYVGAVG